MTTYEDFLARHAQLLVTDLATAAPPYRFSWVRTRALLEWAWMQLRQQPRHLASLQAWPVRVISPTNTMMFGHHLLLPMSDLSGYHLLIPTHLVDEARSVWPDAAVAWMTNRGTDAAA